MMERLIKIITIATLMMLFPAMLSAQNKKDKGKKSDDNYEEMTIKPGIQWDTAIVVKQTHKPEHLIGVRYNYGFTGVSISPDLSTKGVSSPFNIAILYTYYNPLWEVYDIFGLQTGIQYSKYGFKNDKYAFKNFEQTVTVVEIPFVSAFHVDLGEHFRILASAGPFVGYRLSTTKSNGFDCFDKRFDYGIAAGLGLGVIVNRFEFHIEGGFNYSLAMLYHPEKMSSSWWIYSYPWRATINFGVHYKIK